MRALKVLVIVMGVLLVVGFVGLIVAIADRVSKKEPLRAAAPIGQPFTASPIELPRGAYIESMAAGTDRLVLDLVLPDGERRLLIIDLATGRNLGTIPLHTPP
jgi:hypothetical protein